MCDSALRYTAAPLSYAHSSFYALFGNPHQLVVQLIAVVSVGIYSFLATWLILKVLPFLSFPLRVSAKEEAEGLDMSVHGESAYRM